MTPVNGIYQKPCPCCGEQLDYVDWDDAPAGWIDEDGRELFACPSCETELD